MGRAFGYQQAGYSSGKTSRSLGWLLGAIILVAALMACFSAWAQDPPGSGTEKG